MLSGFHGSLHVTGTFSPVVSKGPLKLLQFCTYGEPTMKGCTFSGGGMEMLGDMPSSLSYPDPGWRSCRLFSLPRSSTFLLAPRDPTSYTGARISAKSSVMFATTRAARDPPGMVTVAPPW